MHITDFTKLPQDIILDLINDSNDTAVTADLISFGEPVAADGKVTMIEVTAEPDSGYSGDQTFTYSRVLLSDLVALEAVPTAIVRDVTLGSDILAGFNAKYGLNITSDDVTVDGKNIDQAFVQPNDFVDVVIAAKADSLVWFGSCTISLRPTNPFIALPEGKEVASSDGVTVVRVTGDGAIKVFAV